MEYSYKFRIYPNAEQEKLIHRTFGCCRYVYNHYLSKRMELYKENGSTMNYLIYVDSEQCCSYRQVNGPP